MCLTGFRGTRSLSLLVILKHFLNQSTNSPCCKSCSPHPIDPIFLPVEVMISAAALRLHFFLVAIKIDMLRISTSRSAMMLPSTNESRKLAKEHSGKNVFI